jgi:membrane protease YdiL (CAAX protease family)
MSNNEGQQQPAYLVLPESLNPATIYKARLRKIVKLIALALLAFYLIDSIAAGAATVIFMLINNASEMSALISQGLNSSAPDLFSEDLMDAVPVGLTSIVGIAFGSLALFIVRGKRLVTEDLTRVTNRIRMTDLLKMAALILGVNAAVTLVSLLLKLLLQIWGIPLDGEDLLDAYMNLSGVLYLVLLGPIFEEIMFRGAILRALQPYGENFAIVVSSLLFGAYHLFLFQGIFAFFVGLVLAYCTLRFSLKWSMLLHMLNNGFAAAMDFAVYDLLLAMSIVLVLVAIALVAGFISLPTVREQLHRGKPATLSAALGSTSVEPVRADRLTLVGFAYVRLTPAGQVSAGLLAPELAPPAGWASPVGIAPVGVTPVGRAPVGVGSVGRPQPFAIAFSGASLIVALSIATILSTATLFLL